MKLVHNDRLKILPQIDSFLIENSLISLSFEPDDEGGECLLGHEHLFLMNTVVLAL